MIVASGNDVADVGSRSVLGLYLYGGPEVTDMSGTTTRADAGAATHNAAAHVTAAAT